METYFTVYKVTNKLNGKIYIGSHKTTNLDDGYMGSGKYLRASQNKHGLENFTKEILHIFDNPEEMYAKEAELVNEDFLAEANTYNLKVGGFGGWDWILKNNDLKNQKFTKERRREVTKILDAKAKFLKMWHEDPEYRNKLIRERVTATKERYRNGTQVSNFVELNKDPEFKKKRMDSLLKNRKFGNQNAHFGSFWITNGSENRKIKNADLPEGWRKGRVMKPING